MAKKIGDSLTYEATFGVHQLFERQADICPTRIAIEFEDQSVTYRELDNRSNQLAHYLRNNGIVSGSFVGILMDRSIDLFVAMFGILKAGGAYVPLDPSHPKDRIEFLVQDCTPKLILTQEKFLGLLAPNGKSIARSLDTTDLGISTQSTDRLPCINVPGDTAYLIYTSGSTGAPKGCLNTHAGIANYLQWLKIHLPLGPGDKLLNKTAISFVDCVIEMLKPLVCGAQVVIAIPNGHKDPSYLTEIIKTKGITEVRFVPSMMRFFLEDRGVRDCTSLRTVIASGEALTLDLKNRFYEVLPNAQLYNFYGQSEVVCDCIFWQCQASDKSVPIGRAISNNHIYILDENRRIVNQGEVGELFVGGIQVANGYWKRPDLTAERFIPDPFLAGSKMYRTGDRVRNNGDALEYFGRIDFQVKVRGQRVELGEIEKAILHYASVDNAVVIIKKVLGVDSDLVAYLVGKAQIDVVGLKKYLEKKLPDYMVPMKFIQLTELPVVVSGKVNRQALIDRIDNDEDTARAVVAAKGNCEIALVKIWEGLLNLRVIGREDNFFALGGHSLLAIQLLTRLQQDFQIDMPLTVLFENPTIESFAKQVEQRLNLPGKAKSSIVAVDRNKTIPLSFNQERLWTLNELSRGQLKSNICDCLRFTGPLNIKALEETLRQFVDRHEILRIQIKSSSEVPYQDFVAPGEFKSQFEDWGYLQNLSSYEEKLDERIALESNRIFDLTKEELFSASIIRFNDNTHALLLNMHHIIGDNWSMDILHRELSAMYNAAVRGQKPTLPELKFQYADFALWQRNRFEGAGATDEDLAFWQSTLKGAPEKLNLPVDFQRSAQKIMAKGRDIHMRADLVSKIRKFSEKHNVTSYMFLLSVLRVLLTKYSGQFDTVIGTLVAGREQKDIENTFGFFVNTLALRTELDGATVVEALRREKETTLKAFDHQSIPFEKVIEAINPERDLNSTPIFQVMLNYVAEKTRHPKFDGMKTVSEIRHNPADFDLTVEVFEQEADIRIEWNFDGELFRSSTIERMVTHFEVLLLQYLENPEQKVADLRLLSASEEQFLLKEFCNKPEVLAQFDSVHEIFERQVDLNPNKIALEYVNDSLTYSEVESRSNRVAHFLKKKNVGKDKFVVIFMDRSTDMVISVLGVLKAGGVFVLMDPLLPIERIKFLLDDIDPHAILTRSEYLANIPDDRKIKTNSVDNDWNKIFLSQSQERLKSTTKPEDIAYMVYTSGSTGVPKGCLNTHRGITNDVLSFQVALPLHPTDKYLFKAAVTFDVAVHEILWPLISGASAVIVDSGGQRDADYLLKIIREKNVTALEFVPSMLQIVMEEGLKDCKSLRMVISGGEALNPETVRKFYSILPNALLMNTYGPAEAAVNVTYWLCKPEETSVPIGLPLPNNTIYICNDFGQMAPIGVWGELCIGGPQVAIGYWKRPELTAEKFVVDPFSKRRDAKMYKTGDRARFLSNGLIEYQGRLDFQIKVRGNRVELGEIEASILECFGVSQVAVVAKKIHGESHSIFAYLVSKDSTPVDTSLLQEHLKAKLPDYMVPAAFVRVEELPTMTSGKIDRNALIKRDDKIGFEPRKYVQPEGPVERGLAEIWKSLLQIDQVGRDLNFFNLGGHSLLAIRLASKIRGTFKIDLPLRKVFEYPTLEKLAAEIAQISTGGNLTNLPMKRVARDKPIELSFGQERLWVLEQVQPGQKSNNICIGFRLRGPIQVNALKEALALIVNRHEILRAKIHNIDGVPRQTFEKAGQYDTDVIDLTGVATGEIEGALRDHFDDELNYAFDFGSANLFRTVVYRIKNDEHVLVFNMHHIVSDFWSMGIILKELSEYYNKLASGQKAEVEKLKIQYGDFANWQRSVFASSKLIQREIDYWRANLKGAPDKLNLPLDFARPRIKNLEGQSKEVVFDHKLTESIRKFSEKQGVTVNLTLLSIFSVLISRYSGQTDLVIGCPVANRQNEETYDLVGFFVNTLVLRIDLGSGLNVSQLISLVKEVSLEAYEHQNLPFEKLVEALNPSRDLSSTPLFQVMFNYLNTTSEKFGLKDIKITSESIPTNVAQFDLALDVIEEPDQIRIGWNYDLSLFNQNTIVQMMKHFSKILEQCLNNPEQKLSSLKLLDAVEERKMLSGMCGKEERFELCDGVHQLFEHQVDLTPHKIAVELNNQKITYAELDRRANQLAHYLKRQGVSKNKFVAVLMERSIEMFVAVLGTLKAGAAFVPQYPGYPQERLDILMAETEPQLILTQNAFLSKVSKYKNVFSVDGNWDPNVSEMPSVRLPCVNSPTDIAYMIFTSGSTGKPKGSINLHQGINNYLQVLNVEYPLNPDDRYLFRSLVSFDIVVQEMLWPLIAGAQVVIAEPNGQRDVEYLTRVIQEKFITVVEFVPSMLRVFLEGEASFCKSLRLVLAGGEALQLKVLKDFFVALPNTKLVNAYGPTEATIGVSIWECREAEFTLTPPIGFPLANNKIYILDDFGHLLPPGIFGEIFIGGVQVGGGYWKRTELTAERFVNDPFARDRNRKMYKSGDRARFLADGSIEYQGRVDFQVKIRGNRIELGEIESILLEFPMIDRTVVVAKKLHSTDAYESIVAYYTAKKETVIDTGSFRQFVKNKLPEYMVPSMFIQLGVIPTVSNGKIDRNALVIRDDNFVLDVRPHVPLEGPIEHSLAKLWGEILKIETIGRDDNFFTLGGHSLAVVEMLARIKRDFQIKIPAAEVFKKPTLRELAEILQNKTVQASGNALVSLKNGTVGPPLYLIHALSGDVLSYASVVQHFRPEQTIFGVQTISSEHSGIQELARHHAEEIVKQHPDGPYLLAGWSFGGLIAFEIANQLQTLNKEVRFLGLVDTDSPRSRANSSVLKNILSAIDSSGLLSTKGFKGNDIAKVLKNFKCPDGTILGMENVDYYSKFFSLVDETQLKVFRKNLDADAKYKVTRNFVGDVTLFSSSQPLEGVSAPVISDWAKLIDGDLTVQDVPGDHYSILRTPNAQILAEKIQLEIENKLSGMRKTNFRRTG